MRLMRDPETWWKQMKTDMRDLEIRIYEATMKYLAAQHPAVRMERLAILQSLERAAVSMHSQITRAQQAGVLAPEEWSEVAEQVRQLYILMYRQRLQTLESLWKEEKEKGAKSAFHPLYHILMGARLGLRKAERDWKPK